MSKCHTLPPRRPSAAAAQQQQKQGHCRSYSGRHSRPAVSKCSDVTTVTFETVLTGVTGVSKTVTEVSTTFDGDRIFKIGLRQCLRNKQYSTLSSLQAHQLRSESEMCKREVFPAFTRTLREPNPVLVHSWLCAEQYCTINGFQVKIW